MDINTLFQENRMSILIVAGIILLYIIYLLLKKYVLVRGPVSTLSTLLIPNGIDVNANNTDNVIKNNVIGQLDNKTSYEYSNSFQLTTFVYTYISNFDKNMGQNRNIILKQDSMNNMNFQWYISPNKNDIIFEIKLSNGLNGKVTIPNIKINTWTSVGCIIDGNQANFYRDGKYYRSVVFNGAIKFQNGPILLGKGFGNFSGVNTYSGFLSSFYYSYRAEDESIMSQLHSSGKPDKPKILPEDDKCDTLDTQVSSWFEKKSDNLLNIMSSTIDKL